MQKYKVCSIVGGIATAALLLPLAALAGGHQKPGLWEISTQMDMKNDKLKAAAGKQQPQMTPEMMAKMQQYGIKMPQMPQVNADGSMTQAMTHKFCMTPEQAAKADHPQMGNEQQCKMTKMDHSGNTFSGEMVCDSPEMKGTGNMTMTMDSDEAYHGSMHFSGTSAHGGAMEMTNQISGKWLGADCGDVKTAEQMGEDARARAAAIQKAMGQPPPPAPH